MHCPEVVDADKTTSGESPQAFTQASRDRRVVGRIAAVTLSAAVLALACPAPAFAADLDCADFGSSEAANAELDKTMRDNGYDTHHLDADGDGDACEWNSSATIWTGIGGAVGAFIGFGLSPSSRTRRVEQVVGTAVVAAFVGLFAGAVLPGVMPRAWPVAVFTLAAACASATVEYRISAKTPLRKE